MSKEPILVAPKNLRWHAMQFRADNVKEFLAWASNEFGVSSQPMFALDDDGKAVDGHVWLGRRGDDRDTRLLLNEWVVSGALGPLVYRSTAALENLYEVLS